MGFTVRNVSSLQGSSVSAGAAASARSLVTDPLARAVAAALSARGASVVSENVSVSQIADVSGGPFSHVVLFQAVDPSFSPGARRRLGGAAVDASAAASVPSLYVRCFVKVGDPVLAQSALLGAGDLAGALLLELKALGVPGRVGDPLAPAQFASAWVELGELAVPPVIPWPSAAARPPAAQRPFDALLGLTVGEWVGIAFGVCVGLVFGGFAGYYAGRRNAPPPPPRKARSRLRGRGRGKESRAGMQGMPGAFLVTGAVARDGDDGEDDDGDDDDDDDEDEGAAAAKPRRGADGGSGGAIAVAGDGSVGETVNPMLRMKLKGKAPRRKAGAFAVTSDEDAPRVVAVMDAPRPIERVVFDFTITATTNPYHLLYLGEPSFITMIDKEVERATALAGVCRTAVEKLDADMMQRRAALAKGGVSEATKSSRLLDVVSELAVAAQSAGHAASAEDVAARAAELTAYTVAKQDKALAELRRAKYDELALDLLRLKAVITRGDEARLRIRSFALQKTITTFEPTAPSTVMASRARARIADAHAPMSFRVGGGASFRLPATPEQ